VIRHSVSKGETLTGIARDYNTTVDALVAANPWLEAGLQAGTVIQVPVRVTGSHRHTVQEGENFYKLSRQYDTTVSAIIAANPGVDHTHLKPGQVINIPDVRAAGVDAAVNRTTHTAAPVTTHTATPVTTHAAGACRIGIVMPMAPASVVGYTSADMRYKAVTHARHLLASGLSLHIIAEDELSNAKEFIDYAARTALATKVDLIIGGRTAKAVSILQQWCRDNGKLHLLAVPEINRTLEQ